MRTSMVPGMLNMLAYNLNRGSDNVRLFEAGNVFEAAGEKTAEFKRVCMGATGSALNASVHQPARPLSFFDLKGDLETLLSAFQHGGIDVQSGRRGILPSWAFGLRCDGRRSCGSVRADPSGGCGRAQGQAGCFCC